MVHFPNLSKKDNKSFQEILHFTIGNMRREKAYNDLIKVLKDNKIDYEEIYYKLKNYKNDNKYYKQKNYYTLKKLEYIYGIENIKFLFLLEINKIQYDVFYIYNHNNRYDIKRDLYTKKKTKYFICSNKNTENYYIIFKQYLQKNIHNSVMRKQNWTSLF